MPSYFKKFLLSFLASLVVFLSVAPNFLVANACVTNFECAKDPNASGCIPNPNTGTGQQRSICSTAVTTGVSNAVGNALNGNPSTWYNQGPLDFYQKVFDKSNPSEIFGERYTYAQVSWITYSLVAVILGGDIGDTVKNFQQNGSQAPTSYLQENQKVGGVFGGMMNAISQFYISPPASGTYWLAQEVNKFKIVKTAYAAPTNGFGFSSLQVFLPLWTASRNFAYTIMILITLMLAFAIMFRVKLNPQTAITVQNAIPKIAVTLVLITFSYAIVGFVIDLMYLVFGILTYGISQFGGLQIIPNLNAADLFNKFVNGSLWSEIASWQTIGTTAGSIIVGIYAIIQSGFVLLIPILGILIAIIMFFAKAFIMLAQTYISLVINIVFAPIILLAEAIPFVKLSAMGWLKSVIADVLVFLAVGVLFLAYNLLDGTLANAGGVTVWGAPYMGNNLNIIRFLLWVGLWSMIPNIRKVVYEALEKRAAATEVPRGITEHVSNIGGAIQKEFGVGGRWHK